jgi:hypothetical protein
MWLKTARALAFLALSSVVAGANQVDQDKAGLAALKTALAQSEQCLGKGRMEQLAAKHQIAGMKRVLAAAGVPKAELNIKAGSLEDCAAPGAQAALDMLRIELFRVLVLTSHAITLNGRDGWTKGVFSPLPAVSQDMSRQGQDLYKKYAAENKAGLNQEEKALGAIAEFGAAGLCPKTSKTPESCPPLDAGQKANAARAVIAMQAALAFAKEAASLSAAPAAAAPKSAAADISGRPQAYGMISDETYLEQVQAAERKGVPFRFKCWKGQQAIYPSGKSAALLTDVEAFKYQATPEKAKKAFRRLSYFHYGEDKKSQWTFVVEKVDDGLWQVPYAVTGDDGFPPFTKFRKCE